MARYIVTYIKALFANSFWATLVGIILVPLTIAWFFSNEGNAIDRDRALRQGRREVISVARDRINPANEGRLVHVFGGTSAGEPPRDPRFGVVSAQGIILKRTVEMYQWIESSSRMNNHTTYSYSKEWRSNWIDSEGFSSTTGRRNPKMPYTSGAIMARPVRLGAFELSGELVGQIDDFRQIDLSQFAETQPKQVAGRALRRDGDRYFQGEDPRHPQIGDMRVTFLEALPSEVTVVARQQGEALVPYSTAHQSDIALLQRGVHDPPDLLATAEIQNNDDAWRNRFLYFLPMSCGIFLLFRPATRITAANRLKEFNQAEGCLCSLMLSVALTLVTIGAARLYYQAFWAAVSLAAIVTALVAKRLYDRRRSRGPERG
jgi:hypothetical protein